MDREFMVEVPIRIPELIRKSMEATGFFNIYRIEKAYPDLIDYRESAEWYLEKAYGIYSNRVGAYPIGFYGEQQIPDMIEALYAEGMTEEGDKLKQLFAKSKGTSMERPIIHTDQNSSMIIPVKRAYSAAKALRTYYPDNSKYKGRTLRIYAGRRVENTR